MELDHESVFRLDPQDDGTWSIRRMTYTTTKPNGLLIAPDQRTLYVAQSAYGGEALPPAPRLPHSGRRYAGRVPHPARLRPAPRH